MIYKCPVEDDLMKIDFNLLMHYYTTGMQQFTCPCGHSHAISQDMVDGVDFKPSMEKEVSKMVQRLTIDEFISYYKQNIKRFITELHLQHCWKPDKRTYLKAPNKEAIIQNIYTRDNQLKGLDDFSHHLLITPDGHIWTNRDINQAPSSIKGRNGNDKFGPISIAILGNFDKGKELLEGEQLDALLQLLKFLMDYHCIEEDKFIFHREHSPRTSPGSSLSKYELLQRVRLTVDRRFNVEPLSDVVGHVAEAHIRHAVNNKLMEVYPDGKFYPNTVVTRAELAVVLSNIDLLVDGLRG